MLGFTLLFAAPLQAADSGLSVVWKRTDSDSTLKVLRPGEPFAGLKLASVKASQSRGRETLKGPTLGNLLDATMAGLKPEDRARIDLVILQGEQAGAPAQVWIPRSFVGKVPMVITQVGTDFTAVIPENEKQNSFSRSQMDGLPWGAYGLDRLRRIELANYQERLGGMILKRRTDPAAMRGEKLFVQNCMACHAGSSARWAQLGAGIASTLEAGVGRHPAVQGVRKLDDRSARALQSYWNAWVAEQGLQGKR